MPLANAVLICTIDGDHGQQVKTQRAQSIDLVDRVADGEELFVQKLIIAILTCSHMAPGIRLMGFLVRLHRIASWTITLLSLRFPSRNRIPDFPGISSIPVTASGLDRKPFCFARRSKQVSGQVNLTQPKQGSGALVIEGRSAQASRHLPMDVAQHRDSIGRV